MKKASSTIEVRENNIKLIKQALCAGENSTKAHLAGITGLSVATCGKIIATMVNRGEVFELELARPESGRPPRLYTYNAMYSLTALVFLKTEAGATYIIYEIKDAKNQIVEKEKIAVEKTKITAVSDLLDDLLQRFPSIKAVAISIPGMITNGVIGFCDLPELEGVDLREAILSKHNVELIVENDMNLAALGYYHDMQRTGSVVYLLAPRKTCVGAGIVVDGKLIRGNTSFAGEFSFIPTEVSREKQLNGLDLKTAIDYIATLAAGVIPVINPSTFAIASELLDDTAVATIRQFCLKHIPAKHMPAFIVRKNIDNDCLSGLALMAASSIG